MVRKSENLEKSWPGRYLTRALHSTRFQSPWGGSPDRDIGVVVVVAGQYLTRALHSTLFQNPGGGSPERDIGVVVVVAGRYFSFLI